MEKIYGDYRVNAVINGNSVSYTITHDDGNKTVVVDSFSVAKSEFDITYAYKTTKAIIDSHRSSLVDVNPFGNWSDTI